MSTAVVSSSTSSTSSVNTTVRRYGVRRQAGAPGFIWGGLLPLLGLLALLWYGVWPWAKHDIEATVKRGVHTQLVDRSMGWVNVAVSGQNVHLTGSPANAAAGDDALAMARKAGCPSWLGQRTCAVAVTANWTAPAAPAAAATPAATPVAAAPVPVPSSALACDKSLAGLLSGAHIEFASGSANISAQSASLLDRLADAAKACPGRLAVEGHTDNIGGAAPNKALSQARAQAVRSALAQRGLDAARLDAVGYGFDKPIAPNETAQGRAANRRIEIKTVN